MKTKSVRQWLFGGAFLAGIFFATSIFGQTNLNFNGISATVEGAIQLSWNSTPNEIYEIDEADALATNADGSTAWNQLYTAYPSQGTNTIWLDTGNYSIVPPILHPKYMPARFYRILYTGTNTAPSPSVAVVSPSSGDVLSGQITVSVVAATPLPELNTKLYVDGQEMDMSDDGTNYVINTCEWPNGPHTLFATATARSAFSGPDGVYPIYTGYGVSSFVPVTFNNLISQIAFSQVFFEPSLGQTQEVTANFAANCNWTLQIQDVNSNTVRNASGSGISMTFDWDGMGDGETNIPDGAYTYLISAQVNGQPIIIGGGSGGSGGSGGVPSPAFAPSTGEFGPTQLWAQPSDGSGVAVPFFVYPPGFDTNDLNIFEAPVTWSLAPTTPMSHRATSAVIVSGVSQASPEYSGPSSQDSSAPTRPWTAGVKNPAGTFAIGYYSWPTPQFVNIPQNGIPYPATGVCHLNGFNASTFEFPSLPEAQEACVNMYKAMNDCGWKMAFVHGDQDLPVNSIRRTDLGGGAVFTQATIGLFIDHGAYGTDPDYSYWSSGSKQIYFRSDVDGGDNGWLRMCQFGFGGNLNWMGILACYSLCDPNFGSMVGHGAIPLNTTHLICGCETDSAVDVKIGAFWTKNMLKQKQSITQAWFNAGSTQYAGEDIDYAIIFRVAGYPECINDSVANNTAPSSPSSSPGNLIHTDKQVFP
jgi:hypothetical protein